MAQAIAKKKDRKTKVENLWEKYFKSRTERNRNNLVEFYFPFVQMIANRVAESISWNMQPEELANYGVFGLYTAIEKFNPEVGVKFESYSSRRVKGAMIDGLRREDMVPRSVRMAGDKFEKHKQRLENILGHRISELEVVEYLGMDEETYQKEPRKYHPTPNVSIEMESNPDEHDGSVFAGFLIDNKMGSPTGKTWRKEFFSKLVGNDFTDIERQIVYLYYYEGLTMKKIAKQIGLCESRISQMHKRILPRLADKIRRNPEYFGDKVYKFVEDCKHTESLF